MHRGSRVSLHGLQSRPELNGQPATLILWDVSAHVENGRPTCQIKLRVASGLSLNCLGCLAISALLST
jgi:hypothetical protein